MSTSAPSRDRRQLLLAPGATLNGIDYVEVTADQTHLYVHFLNDVTVGGTLAATTPVTITGGEVIPTVAVEPFDPTTAFSADSEGRPVLALEVAAPGDFSTYQLSISSTALDPFLSSVEFSFKAGCPSDLDCAPAAASCAAPEPEAVKIDYLAKDFQSFTQALTEFSTARYPAWQERSEADLGMMLMEALAALADELSYLQDRVSAEASIVTATQRVSVLRHARLVDYEPTPATAATTRVQLDVTEPGVIDTPLHCQAVGSDGNTIDFEVGAGLADPLTGTERRITIPVDPRWNRYVYGPGSETSPNLQTYWWDDSEVCLAAGSTQLYLAGQDHGLYAGQQLLLDTPGPDSADPRLRELVTVTGTSDVTDPLLGNDVTLVSLADPTALDHDLSTTTVAGNLVPAVQGRRATDVFYIPGGSLADPAAGGRPAVVRTGANWTPDDPQPDYRYCLASDPLAWIPVDATAALPTVIDGAMTADQATLTSATANFTPADVESVVTVQGAGADGTALTTAIQAWTDATTVTLAAPAATTVAGATVVFGAAAAARDGDVSVPAVPELVLTAQPPSGPPTRWRFVRWLLGAGAGVEAFTLTPERYSPVLSTGSATYFDYDGDDGTTIRFGDGTFGLTPTPGTLFSAVYRVGAGVTGNVAADTIVTVAPGQTQGPLVRACTNPFAADGGADAETIGHVARSAPQQFASTLTLVKPADYAAAAQSLPFVQQAGARFRWTGSWLSAFTTANPVGSEQPDAAELESVTELLDRRRMAGYESYVLPPRYVSIDLALVICADPNYFAAAVQAAVIAQLVPGAAPGGDVGFFDHSRWSFGAPLQSSALFAAVQSCIGVAGILSASYRQRGAQLTWTELPETLTVAADQILRVDDDPSRPDAGLLTVTVEGGK